MVNEMEETITQHCVLLPCSDTERWAIPQNCLAEIVSYSGEEDSPPSEIDWRGKLIPVLDLKSSESPPWRNRLIAVVLGLEGEGLDYWGVALRGDGLTAVNLAESAVEDLDEVTGEHSSASFRIGEQEYQVPDLLALQKHMTATHATR